MTDPLAMIRNKKTSTNSQNASSFSDQSLPNSLSDSRMQTAIEYVNSHGGDPKQAAIKLCNEMGISGPINPVNLISVLIKRKG